VRKLPPNVGALRSVPGLDGVRDRELARLSPWFDEVRVPAGCVLSREGGPAHDLTVVVAGLASSTVRDDRIGVIGPGSVLGEAAVLGAGPHRATVVSRTPMRVLVAGCDACRRLRHEPAILRLIARDLARRASGGSRAVDGRAGCTGWRLTG
jgi:CRP/FNR family cyclic AMP-dependent transcriptional regulator